MIFDTITHLAVLVAVSFIIAIWALLRLRRKTKWIVVCVCVLATCMAIPRLRWQLLAKEMFALHKDGQREASLEKALALMRWSRMVYSEQDVPYVEAVHHVGWLNWDSKRFEKAEHLLTESLRLYEQIESRNTSGNAFPFPGVHGSGNEHSLLADVYEQTNRLQQAEWHLLKSIAYYEKRLPRDRWYLIMQLQNLERVYRRQGRQEEAAQTAQKTKQLKSS